MERLEDRRVLANNVPLAGQFAAELVRDINTSPLSSQTYNLTQVNGAMYFTASTLASGNELWRTDGTAAGTRLVKDIVAGSAGSDPLYLTNIGGTLYFFADDGVHGFELWRSDGTAAGTTLVKDIIAGQTGSVRPIGPAENVKLTNVSGTMFFRVDRGFPNSELWKSDGTAAGTLLVSTVDVADRQSEGSLNDSLRNVNGTLFFNGRDATHGYELWRSDGTPAGTKIVKDIRAGAEGSEPGKLRNVNGILFFTANDGSHGNELWRSDGTAAGTKIVKDLQAGTASSGPANLANVQGTLFFTADDGAKGNELWQSDGTAAGTKLVKDIRSGSPSSEASFFTFANGELYFTANDGSHGQELWRSDGTPAGTTLVKDIQTGSTGSRPNYLINVNGELFFGADDSSGRKLWRSDGTAAGTVLVKDVLPAFSQTIPDSTAYFGGDNRGFINLSGKLLFSASDGSHGFELWRSDGTSGGTTLVKDIREGTASSSPLQLTNVGGTLFFEASDDKQSFGPSYKLWRSDGTAAGTVLVKDMQLQAAEDPDGQSQYMEDLVFLANAGGRLFFDAPASGNNYGLWTSDGTSAGTLLLNDIVLAHRGYASYDGSYLLRERTTVDGKLFFTAGEGRYPADPVRHGFELWISDGTVEGTMLVKDIRPGRYSAYPTNLTNTSGVVYFDADDGVHGNELWRSDGTEAGTTLVKDIHPGAGGTTFSSFINIDGILYFSADGVGKGKEVWRSDGTAEGTFRITDLNPSLADSSPGNLIDVGGTLFFTATDGASGVELWRSDGTAAGTSRVKDIMPGSAGSSPADLTNVNGRLYFTATDGVHGRELWRSDGTAANTQLVKDLRPGAADGKLVSLTHFQGRLMFQGDDGVHGNKLWESNGAAAGTRIVAGSATAVIADAPSLEVMGDALYFAAPLADGGAELFRYGPQADTHTMYQGDPFSGTLSGFDPDGDTLTFAITSGPSHGQITSFNSSTGAYTYKPFRSYAGADSFTYQASDGTASSNEATVSFNLLFNSAPRIDPAKQMPLDTIQEDTTKNPGTQVWKLLTDVLDTEAKRGLAVTYASNTANGVWQYTLDGGQTWVNLGAVSKTAARLIPADGANSRIRFLPKADFNGSIKIGYYAWDQTRGSAGDVADVSTDNLRGDPTAFSESYRASSLTIAPVNDRPVVALSGTIGYVHDKPAITLAAFARVSDVDSVNFGGGRLLVHVGVGASTSNRLSIGGGFSIDANNNVLQGTKIIGQRTSNGFGTHDLIVTFNWQVTPTIARDLIRAITFKTVGGAAGQRKVLFSVSDGDGGLSAEASKTVNVT